MVNSVTRKLMLVIATAVMVLLVGGRLFTNSQISAFNEHAARQLVLRHVPVTAVQLDTLVEKGHFNFHYYDIPTGLHYRIDVDSRNGKLNEMHAGSDKPTGSKTILLNERIVRSIINRQFQDAAIDSIELQSEFGIKRYLVDFSWSSLHGLATINPETGELQAYSLQDSPRAIIPYVEDRTVTAQAIAVNSILPADRIRTIAMNYIVGGTVVDLSQDQQNGTPVYVVLTVKNQETHRLVFDATTGLLRSQGSNSEPYESDTVRLPERSRTIDSDRLLQSRSGAAQVPQ